MRKTTDLKGATGVYTVNLDTLSMCPGGHPILYRGLKLNSKISAGKYKKNQIHWGQLIFHWGSKQKICLKNA